MASDDSTPPSISFRVASPSVWILSGEIDYRAVLDCLTAIHTTDPHKALLFLLETYGGLAHGTLGLLKELAHFRQVETRAVGAIGSAGVHLLQAGTHRTCYRHTEFFTHGIQCEAAGIETANASSFATQLTRSLDDWIDILVCRTKKKRPKFWQQWFLTDRWFDSAEAFNLGLVDEILD